jgi:hypothetical protein
MPPPIVYPQITFTAYTDVTGNINNNPKSMYYGQTSSTGDQKIAFDSFGGNIFYFGKSGTGNNGNIHQLITSGDSGSSFQNTTFFTNGTSSTTNSIIGCCMDSTGTYRYFSYNSTNTSATNAIYRSINSGASFSQAALPLSPPTNYTVKNIQCSNNGKYVIVAGIVGSNTKVYTLLSCDYGANFQNISNSSSAPSVLFGNSMVAWVSNDGYRVLLAATRLGMYLALNARNPDDTPNTIDASYNPIPSLTTGSDITQFTSISVSEDERYFMCIINTTLNRKGVYVAKPTATSTSSVPLTTNTNFTRVHSSLSSYYYGDMNYSGSVMAFTNIATNICEIYYSNDYGTIWRTYTITGFTSVRGFGLVKKDAVGYIILTDSTNSNPTWFKIT